MTKQLLQNEEEWEIFKSCYGPHTTPKTRLNNKEFNPERYPCVAVTHEWDNPNGPYETEIEFVYRYDFDK